MPSGVGLVEGAAIAALWAATVFVAVANNAVVPGNWMVRAVGM